MFQPQEQSIGVVDVATALPIAEIQLPLILANAFDALVSDGTDNLIMAITDPGDGIALIDLSSVPEPARRPGQAGAEISHFGGKLAYSATSKSARGGHLLRGRRQSWQDAIDKQSSTGVQRANSHGVGAKIQAIHTEPLYVVPH